MSFSGAYAELQGYDKIQLKHNTLAAVDNVGIYNSVLTDADIKTLISYERTHSTLPQLVPEPASATLSLLALAGLCVRRRRK